MKRLTDHLATTAVLALAGYAVAQLVRDVRAIRYVDAVLARGGLTPASHRPSRVLPWDEAIKMHATETSPPTYVPHFTLDVRTGRAMQRVPLPGRRWNP